MCATEKGRSWSLCFLERNCIRTWCLDVHYLYSKTDVDNAWRKESIMWDEWIPLLQVPGVGHRGHRRPVQRCDPPTSRPPASSSWTSPPSRPSTSVRTTWPSTALPAPQPRRSSSATTTSTPAPARSPAPCWQKSSGPLPQPVASPSPALPGPSSLT